MNVTILNYLFLKIMMNIIIVEDNIKFAEVLKEYLELELKHNVVCVFTNGNEFLENISKCFADMVLIDINMPFMNGYEIGKKYNFINSSHTFNITEKESKIDVKSKILMLDAWIEENKSLLLISSLIMFFSLIGISILFGIIALIFGIFGLFNGGFSNFFPSIGAGFNFVFDIGLFIADVVVWIFNATGFILSVFWDIVVWLWDIFWILAGITWDIIVWIWDISWFLIGIIWNVVPWLVSFLLVDVIPFVWQIIVVLWDGFSFLALGTWDILVWLFVFTFVDLIPFFWDFIVAIWNVVWFLIDTIWRLVFFFWS
jgi:hypothetical protein